MIQLTTLKIDTRYVPGTRVYFIDADLGRPTLRFGTITQLDVTFYNDGGLPQNYSVSIREIGLARNFFGEVDVADVYLDAGSAAKALASLMSEK